MRYEKEVYGRPNVPLTLTVRMVKLEVVEALLYGCMARR